MSATSAVLAGLSSSGGLAHEQLAPLDEVRRELVGILGETRRPDDGLESFERRRFRLSEHEQP